MLKMDDGAVGLDHLLRIFHLLLILTHGRRADYTQSVLMQILMIAHQQSNGLPMWTILSHSLSCYNEEAGEIAFAMLARCVRGDSSRVFFEHMEKSFLLLHGYASTERIIKEHRSGVDEESVNWRRRIDPTGIPVQETTSFVRSTLRQIRFKTYKQYPRIKKGKPKAYKKREEAMAQMVKYEKKAKSLWEVDVQAALETQIEKCKTKYSKRWMARYVNIWPECKGLASEPHVQPVTNLTDSSETTEEEPIRAPLEGERQEVVLMPRGHRPQRNATNSESDTFTARGLTSGSGSDVSVTEGETSEESAASRVDPGPFMYDDSRNVLSGGRSSRPNRGRRLNDAHFPILTSITPILQPSHGRRSRRVVSSEHDSPGS
jgi:hypothetical protein